MASTRKRSLVPILLFCVLLTLVVAKVINFLLPKPLAIQPPTIPIAAPIAANRNVDPNSIRVVAQLAQGTIPQQPTSTPVYASCAEIPEPPSEEGIFPNCSVSNIADFVAPDCGGVGSSCGVVNGSSITLSDSYIGNVTNEVEVIKKDSTGTYIKQKSNDIHFIYRRNPDGSVSLVQDTIWGGGPAGGFFTCDGTTQEAFYRVYDANGNLGNSQYASSATCGGPEHQNVSVLGTFKKVSDSGININDPGTDPLISDGSLTSCNVSGQTGIPVGNKNRLIYHGNAVCNGVPFEMIAMQNTEGAGAGEVNMYCKGKGICAFYQLLDLTVEENKPINWDGKDLCNLQAGGSRENLTTYFEYNLQRQCKETPTKVLNNFLDEYSVSCVPEADYILSFLDRELCALTDKGCYNWNTTGDLRFAASGSLFGLFRNQNAVEARYNTMNGLKDKDRQESIEAYLTAKVDELPLSAQSSNIQFNGLNPANAENLTMYQSPLYKLSTLEQQCQLVYDKLTAVEELCLPFNRIEGTENEPCAINQFLPNTSLRYTDMLTKMRAPNGESKCESLMNPSANNTEATALRDQILSIDPAMEVAYRPAFIVVASFVGKDPGEILNPEFLSQGNDKSKFWQVDYMEVKVPTFGSDFMHKDNMANASNPTRPGSSYRDPLRFLADVLTTPEIQEMYRQEEENDRNAIRSKVIVPPDRGAVQPGDIIGMGGYPIKCRFQKGTYTEDACDYMARALIAFINASNVVPVTPGEGEGGASVTRQFSPARSWLPASKCDTSGSQGALYEKNLYGNSVLTEDPVDPKYRVAEEAQTIGSKLEAVNQGFYEKKLEGFAEVEANVTDMNPPPGAQGLKGGDFGHTQVFFVSPHNYTLLYAQNAMLSLLTEEQQEIFLKNENFNSVMKTTGLDNFSSSIAISYYDDATPGTTPPPVIPGETAPPLNRKPVTAELQRKKDDEPPNQGKTLDSPLMWQVAGSIANIPTRLYTLVSTTLDNPTRLFTLGCTGSYATEQWLLGRCTPVKPEDAATNPGNVPPSNNASNQCVAVYMDAAEAQTAAAEIRANLPGQQLQSPSFAGWARYYSVGDRPEIQHLFQNHCNNGQPCIDYILDQVLNTSINGKTLNPYLVMSIAMNETGGLISSKPGYVGPHFGCGIGGSGQGGQIISDGSIESKLQCLTGFFQNYAARTRPEEQSDDAALTLYGYRNGSRNNNLVKIMGILSNGKYPLESCNGSGTTPAPSPTQN